MDPPELNFGKICDIITTRTRQRFARAKFWQDLRHSYMEEAPARFPDRPLPIPGCG
jgi:hypothetical protein